MRKEFLRKIGLTEGEIRVYSALVKLGKSSTGRIMEESGISSSKVYLILEKLVKKGFASYILENNVKQFYVTNPINIIEYLKKQQKELEKTKEDARTFAAELTKLMGTYEEESAQIYKGFAGMRGAFQNILSELKKGEEFLFFGSPEFKQKNVVNFFRNLHAKRTAKGILTRGIIDLSCKQTYIKGFKGAKRIEFKFLPLTIPHALAIGKTRVILTLWGESPMAFEIVSKRLAQKYKDYFYKVWGKH